MWKRPTSSVFSLPMLRAHKVCWLRAWGFKGLACWASGVRVLGLGVRGFAIQGVRCSLQVRLSKVQCGVWAVPVLKISTPSKKERPYLLSKPVGRLDVKLTSTIWDRLQHVNPKPFSDWAQYVPRFLSSPFIIRVPLFCFPTIRLKRGPLKFKGQEGTTQPQPL